MTAADLAQQLTATQEQLYAAQREVLTLKVEVARLIVALASQPNPPRPWIAPGQAI